MVQEERKATSLIGMNSAVRGGGNVDITTAEVSGKDQLGDAVLGTLQVHMSNQALLALSCMTTCLLDTSVHIKDWIPIGSSVHCKALLVEGVS